jgi:hypothetical protein
MRVFALLVCVLFALPTLAQNAGPASPDIRMALPRYEARIHELSKDVSFMAFAVTQLVLATRELDDFQINVAIDKAHERMKDALKRAKEEEAAPVIIDTFTGLVDTFQHAQEQGAMASIPTLRADLVKHAEWMQRLLFSELDHAREERRTLLELQTKVNALNADLESAMIQALGATFDFIKTERK